MEAARASGFRIAFSFFGGMNPGSALEPFNVRRQAVIGRARFRMRVLMASIAGIDY
jgi:hypothetical protein